MHPPQTNDDEQQTRCITYTPAKSLRPLFTDSKLWNVIVGPLGSTKTSACIFYLLMRAARQQIDNTGWRRTRFVISRTTLPQLKATVLRDIMEYIGPLVTWRPSENLIRIVQPPIHSEWFLIPLESETDRTRLLSMQLSGVWFNEGREIPFSLMSDASGRITRFPPPRYGGPTHPFILVDTNPGAVNSDLYKFCVEQRPPELLYIHQPSGLSDEADWFHYLTLGRRYYEQLMIGASQDWIDVHVHGQWGKDLTGAAVYASIFDFERHTGDFTPRPGLLTVVGLDPGRQPAAVVAQLAPDGRIFVTDELASADTNFFAFLHGELMPLLRERYFRNSIMFVIDPAGVAKSTLSEYSPYTVCKNMGLEVMLAPTNRLEPRKLAVENLLLSSTPRGTPMLNIDRNRCPILIRGMRGEYRYKRHRSGELALEPEKKHPISDVMDALQYLALYTTGKRISPLSNTFERYQQVAGQAAVPVDMEIYY